MAQQQQQRPAQQQTRAVATSTQRETFGGREVAASGELATQAAAAQARAMIEAQYIMAERHPRDWDDVRARLLKECLRPSFAKVARYRKPVAGGKYGPSIRFAEAALRIMKNVSINQFVIHDDDRERVVRVFVTDLESNTTYSRDVTIEKVVERSSLREDQVAIGVRTNSAGKKTYLVAATEDDLLNKEGALLSKAIRNNGLRVVPGDIVDECMAKVIEVQQNDAAKDPDAERKAIADGFMRLNVPPSEIKRYLGHDLGECTPAELVELRQVYETIKDGEATWHETLKDRLRERADAENPPPAGDAPPADKGAEQGATTATATAEAQAKLRGEAPADDITATGEPEPTITSGGDDPAIGFGDDAQATTQQQQPGPRICPCPDGPTGKHLPGCAKDPAQTVTPAAPKPGGGGLFAPRGGGKK